MDVVIFVEKFVKVICIVQIDFYWAIIYNKGIFNGIDVVVLVIVNDFWAIEVCGYVYVVWDGCYCSFSSCIVKDGVFKFWMDLFFVVGIVGGLICFYFIVCLFLEMLGYLNVEILMMIIVMIGFV